LTATAAPTPSSSGASSRCWLLLVLLALVTAYRGLSLYYDGLDLYLDEAQYWTWAQHLEWGYTPSRR